MSCDVATLCRATCDLRTISDRASSRITSLFHLQYFLPHLTAMTKPLSVDLHVHICIYVDIVLYILTNKHVMLFARTFMIHLFKVLAT